MRLCFFYEESDFNFFGHPITKVIYEAIFLTDRFASFFHQNKNVMKPAFFTKMKGYGFAQTIIGVFIVFLLILSIQVKPFAQSYNIDDVDGQVLYIYSETITLYDSGGPNGDYGGGEDYTVTICTDFQLAGCPAPREINAIFNFIDIEPFVDCFYDGLTIDGVTYCNFNLPPAYGTTAISYVSNPDGCMVVHFYSDPADPFGGFSVNFVADQVAIVVEDPLECGSEIDGFIGGAIHGCPSCLEEYECGGSYYGFEEQYNISATGNVTLTIDGDVDFFVYGLFTNIGPNGCPPVTMIGCAIGSETSVSFNADDFPFGIWVIIDSEFAGEYHISLSCGSGDLDCDDAEPIQCGDNFFDATFAGTGGVNNVNDYCDVGFNSYTGREKLYEFVATYTGVVTITLTGLEADLDLFILDGCDASSCVDGSDNSNTEDESVTFDVIEGEHYIIVVDGYELAESVYWINVTCQGDLDCSDDEPIECGDVVLSSNSVANGGNNSEVDYCGDGSSKWTGRERIYSFYAERNEILNITLSDLDANLDLFLLEACISSDCASRSDGPGTSDETITFEVHQGQTYIIVIDGVNDATSTYRLEVECDELMCKDCGDCFTYTIFDKGITSNVTCYPKYVDCGVDHFPSGDHQFQWTVDGNVKSTKFSPTLSLENNKKSKVCQVVKYKGTEIFKCCWDITPVAGCSKPPVAHAKLGGEWPFYDAVLDASESTDGKRYNWEFGDGTLITDNGTDPTIEHTYSAGGPKYSAYVQNDFGISVYTREFAPGAIECTAGENPKFTYTLNGRSLTVKDVDNTAATIFSYKIDFGDSTAIVQGDGWANKVHNFAKDSVYEICIRYVTSYNQGFFQCFHEGCVCFSVKVGCCQQAIDQCENINYKFISENGGLEYSFTQIAADVQVLNWEIDDVSISNSQSNTINHVFTSSGLHKVCCYFRDPSNGCYIKCCRLINIDNPFTCGNIKYRFHENQGGYRFTLDEPAAEVEELTWKVDSPGSQELGTNMESNVLPVPSGQCRQYVISARYYDKVCGCYRLCCFRMYLCNPTGCSDVIKTSVTNELKTRFYTDQVYPEMQWYVNDELVSTASTYERWWPTNAQLQVCLYFLDPSTNNHQVCCTDVTTSVKEDLSLRHVDIYPSPATDELNISIDFSEPTRVGVELINEIGVVVRHAPMGTMSSTKFNQRLDLESVAPGMYFVKVRTEKEEMVRKVICF